MGDVVKIEWVEQTQYAAFIRLPEGVSFEDFRTDDYDLENGLGEINYDLNSQGTERTDIEIYQQQQPGKYDEVEELDWETLRNG